MSEKVGNKSFFDSSGQSEYSFQKPYSEKTAELIDDEVSRIIDEQYKRAKKILIDNHDKHVQLAEVLLDREVIFSEDLEKLFGKRKLSEHVIDEEDLEGDVNEEVSTEIETPNADEAPETSSETSDKNESEPK